jgi:hypothetical protein
VTGGAALAAVLAVRRHARRLDVVQHNTDLHTWESEGRSPVQLAVVKPRSCIFRFSFAYPSRAPVERT